MGSTKYHALLILRRMLGYVGQYKKYALLGMLGVVSAQILAVLIPQVLRDVIDHAIVRADREYLLHMGLLVFGLGVLRGLAGFLSRYYVETASHRVAYDIRNTLYDKVQRLSFSYHDSAKTGELITRGISDVDQIQLFVALGMLDGLNTILIVLFSVIMMFITSPILAAAAFLPLIPIAVRSKYFAAYVQREWDQVMKHIGNLGNQLQETLVGAEVVRAFSRESFEIEKFGQENSRLHDQQLRVVRAWGFFIPFSAVMVALSSVITLVFGGWLIQQGYTSITVGVIVQFNFYILLMAQPLRLVGFIIMQINTAIASGQRVFEILDAAETIQDKPDAVRLPHMRGLVEFKNVNFRYAETLPMTLHNLNLRAEPGQVIALLGKTGSGKSTMMSLIPRFYDVTEGCVTIDGCDVRDIQRDSLRQNIGIVLQESLLFSATVRENIAFGRPDASEEEIINAARAANAHPFILELPQGYDTLVGERGITLSGGQRQRIAIARALVMNPAILILDDSTSSVDTETEYKIQQALRRLMHNRTTFIIAQRLTSVLHADEILVLDAGRIAERGKHTELLALNGLYRDIYELQLADQERVRSETRAFERGALTPSAAD